MKRVVFNTLDVQAEILMELTFQWFYVCTCAVPSCKGVEESEKTHQTNKWEVHCVGVVNAKGKNKAGKQDVGRIAIFNAVVRENLTEKVTAVGTST